NPTAGALSTAAFLAGGRRREPASGGGNGTSGDRALIPDAFHGPHDPDTGPGRSPASVRALASLQRYRSGRRRQASASGHRVEPVQPLLLGRACLSLRVHG